MAVLVLLIRPRPSLAPRHEARHPTGDPSAPSRTTSCVVWEEKIDNLQEGRAWMHYCNTRTTAKAGRSLQHLIPLALVLCDPMK